MQIRFSRGKDIIYLFILALILLFLNSNIAFGLSYHLPWTNYESYMVTQGNGGIYSHQGKFFYAWDFAMPEGTLIRASAPGKVVKVQDTIPGYQDKSWGNYVIIQHENGLYSRYAHLQFGSIIIKPGMMVFQGQVIGRSGNTGNSTGPHLHYQVENKEGFSVPSLFAEVGVPLTGQNVMSQNNFISNNSSKSDKRINYKKLYSILNSKEFRETESKNRLLENSPTEKYLNSSLNNIDINKNNTTKKTLTLLLKDNFKDSSKFKILNVFLSNIPFVNIISSNFYYVFRLMFLIII